MQNRSGHMNCFLNTGLQLIWSLWLTSDIDSLKAFITLPPEEGPELSRPLMLAITEFYKEIGEIYNDVPKFSSIGIRREMFKLYYRCESFDLNEKADAFEAFDFLLTCIHSWVRQSQIKPLSREMDRNDDQRGAISSKLAKLSEIECDQKNSCFVHKNFYLSKVSKRLCTTCNLESDQEFR